MCLFTANKVNKKEHELWFFVLKSFLITSVKAK